MRAGGSTGRVSDFGFGNTFDPTSTLATFCGSPLYAAPELFKGVPYTGPEVDIWALGIVLYVMTTSCLPFAGQSFFETKAYVCAGKFVIPDYVTPSTHTVRDLALATGARTDAAALARVRG